MPGRLMQSAYETSGFGGRIRWLTVPIYVGCAVAFLADVNDDTTLNYGLFYVPLVCTAAVHRNPRSVWWLALLSIFCVILGYFLPHLPRNLLNATINRALAITTILITAALVHYMRTIQDRLEQQTLRAEQAERMKTETFTNLGQELRTPLHAIIGLSGLMMTDCRADQRPPLSQVQAGGRRLLATIDNLIDMSGLSDRLLHDESVDVAQLLRDATAAARTAANERNITVDLAVAEDQVVPVRGDAWAMRRITDNLLANAVKFTAPGGSVAVSLEACPQGIRVLVEDTGVGMSPDLVELLSEPVEEDEPVQFTGTGLYLSRHLAHAMGAELVFRSIPSRGTTVELRLPNAPPDQASR